MEGRTDGIFLLGFDRGSYVRMHRRILHNRKT
jgi:hypothetical protein